jgi:hypothetical protein
MSIAERAATPQSDKKTIFRDARYLFDHLWRTAGVFNEKDRKQRSVFLFFLGGVQP